MAESNSSGNQIEQGGPGPYGSGEQGVPGGGGGEKDTDTGAIHYTDHGQGSHHSWDEKGGNVSGQHTTTHNKK